MSVRPPRGSTGAIAVGVATWTMLAGCLVVAALLQYRLVEVQRQDLALSPVEVGVYLAATASSALVGTVLVSRRAGGPIGALFLVLAISVAMRAALDLYATVGAVARPGSLRGAVAVAYIVDPWFLAFFVLIAWVLHLVPTGSPLTWRWGWGAVATTVAAVSAFAAGVVSDAEIDPPFDRLGDNPLAIRAVGGVATTVFEVGASLAAAGLLVGAASIVVRYRRSSDPDRRRLWWLALAAVPIPLFVLAVFAVRDADDQATIWIATGGWIVTIPVATLLAISRAHLFDIDRIVSETASYLALTAAVIATYAAVVMVIGQLVGDRTPSTFAAILGTLAAVTVAAPARRVAQTWLDRHFNRRRFDAVHIVEDHLRRPGATNDIDAVLRQASGDLSLSVAYPVGDDRWVDADGRSVNIDPAALAVRRGTDVIALVSYDPAAVDGQLVDQLAHLAVSELDNARLRAALAVELVEVHESRARIASAQRDERRRIERNLHDGAQQRLLALGFELRAAQLNGQPRRLADAVAAGIEQTHAALVELRALANGLHSNVLADGGLAAALDDLGRRTPDVLHASCTEARFEPGVEETAWFVICEAVSNAHKHAAASPISVDVGRHNGWLSIEIRDRGPGGADPTGSGLEGLRDRVEAVGGTFQLTSPAGGGTTIRSQLPCGP